VRDTSHLVALVLIVASSASARQRFSRSFVVVGLPSLLPAFLLFGKGSPGKIIPRIYPAPWLSLLRIGRIAGTFTAPVGTSDPDDRDADYPGPRGAFELMVRPG
jgi:hypothetical protein